MYRHRSIRLLVILIAVMLSLPAEGQFYNGLQMSFGKNRVQYYDYYWSFYRFENIDCYFKEEGRELAKYTADYAIKKLEEIENFFDYTLEKRLIFIIFNKQAEYKQSNVGLVTFSEDDYNMGGYSRIIKNKVLLYYEGTRTAYERQIASSIADVIIKEMIAGADLKDRTNSSQSFYMPDWYFKGLVNYVAFGWDYETENRVKDGFRGGKFKNINHLQYEDAISAGQSFWRFLGDRYGDALIPSIIYLTKIYKNINDGFLYVTGQKLGNLLKEWQEYYREEFSADRANPPLNEDRLKRSKKDQLFQQVKISPDQRFIAWVTNDWGRKRIWVHDQQTGKTRIVFRAEPRYEHKTDNTYPVIAWHPNGNILTFINEEKSLLKIYFHRVPEKTTESRLFLYLDKVLDFSYSPDGTQLILSGVKEGFTDIYLHTIASGTNEQITRDSADDLNPSFIKGSQGEIIFSSNRQSDTLTNRADPFERTGLTYDLFTYNIRNRGNLLTRLTEGRYTDRYQPVSTGKQTISYLGNGNGVINRYTASFDSTISFIDTTTHYRYFLSSIPVTDYDRNISYHDVTNNSDSYGEVIYSKGRNYARKGRIDPSLKVKGRQLAPTSFRNQQNKLLHKADSIEQLRLWLLAEDKKRRDTLKKPLYEYYAKDEPIDFNHYIFEIEKQNYYEQLWRKDYMNIDLGTDTLDLPLIRIYQTSFYNNYLAGQVDFNFLNNSYQPYNGGAPYFNPGANLFTRIGILDLFEDYKLTGGFRFAGNFDSNEYLLSLENLKGRFDKQLTYHRMTFFSSNDTANFKIHSDNLYLTFTKAFSPVLALKGTTSYRYDKYVFLSTNVQSLSSGDISRHWAGLKGELIYDNTRKLNINIYSGLRFKIFGEYYKELNRKLSDMIVIGADFRHYTKIHRELIWANRFAASTSYGPTKLIYYLGGVDNWMGYIFNKIPMFDQSLGVNPYHTYGFQALATNMRGFSQNIRNGNSFALINSEIRWPFIRYFAGHPLRLNFLNSLQLVGFGDVGTAWSGKSPWSGENSYDRDIIVNGPVTVYLDTNRQPIVAGVGAGLRAQVLGYFVRGDFAWGIENGYILPMVFYLSFSLDF